MLTTIRKFVIDVATPADAAYTTVIYPTRGVPVVVHDGLGIAQARPWYLLPVVEPEEVGQESFDMQPVDDDLTGRRAQCGGRDAGFGFVGGLNDLVSTATGFSSNIGDPLIDVDSPFSMGHSASGFAPFEELGSFNDGGFPDSYVSLGVNPASGLPMMDSSFDVAGNPFGMS